jgi:crotonobetainyl-CoA:carnitine CoA-transferase CaiB-like acyl-CoA transferase
VRTPPDLLAGTTVLDLGVWRPVPFATQLLAELGATVTKVEPPGGDPMQVFPDLYRSLNHAKAIVELDLKDPTDHDRALELAASADVVLEGFRPGVADRLGLGHSHVAERNPTVVYCSVSGFGQDGPFASTPGHDLNYQAWSGVLAARMPEIRRSGVPLGDIAGGTYAAMSVCAALVDRARSGRGCRIDVSMTDILVTWAHPEPGGSLADSDEPGGSFPAYGTFECRDGWLTLGVVTEDNFWRALCTELHLTDLADLKTADRAADGPALRQAISRALADRDRDTVLDALLAAGVPVAPVLSGDEAVQNTVATAAGLSTPGPDGTARLAHPVRYTRPDDTTG